MLLLCYPDSQAYWVRGLGLTFRGVGMVWAFHAYAAAQVDCHDPWDRRSPRPTPTRLPSSAGCRLGRSSNAHRLRLRSRETVAMWATIPATFHVPGTGTLT